MASQRKMAASPKPISLALQGGGAHGAFEWGVLDRLLEHGGIEVKAVAAASAGAMNAVCLADGFIENGADGARARLESFWREVNRAGGRNVFGDSAVWSAAFNPATWLQNTPGWRLAENLAMTLSPYEFNPFNLNPLNDVLEAQVNFKAIRERSPIALYISATEIRTSKARIFRNPELTAKQVMASACLPYLFQAVEIDGEAYWDGGYLANPPIWPLFYDQTPKDILVVNLNPLVRDATPKTPGEIMDRLNEITFNASLVSQLRSVAFVQKLIEEGLLKDAAKGRYRDMYIHAITADGRLDDLTTASKFDTEWTFLQDLKARGRAAADDWLATAFVDVGVKSSIDVRASFL